MPLIQIEVDLSYEVVTQSTFLFQLAVARTNAQEIRSESLTIGGRNDLAELLIPPDGIRAHRLVVEPGPLEVTYRAEVQTTPVRMDTPIVPDRMADHPAEVLPYTYPSRYCESNLLMNAANDLFGQVPPETRIAAICDWAADTLAYTPGSTNVNTTASDVFLSRRGVCRDYAHVATTLSRAFGVPTRYTAGYVVDLDPPDFHAVIEAYIGGRWWLFDATRLAPLEGFVRIGSGRDAADVSFATFDGQANPGEMRVSATFADGTQTDANDLTPLSLCG